LNATSNRLGGALPELRTISRVSLADGFDHECPRP